MLEAKIVTANGDVVIASEYQNEDLFYAMRGIAIWVVKYPREGYKIR